jgi:ankyrin repeat protein
MFLDIVQQLLAKNIHINATLRDYGSALQLAMIVIEDGLLLKNVIDLLLAKGADVNVVDGEGFTALMGLCESRNIDTIKNIAPLLLAKGAKLDAKDRQGVTAFDYVDKNYTASLRDNASQKDEVKKFLQSYAKK